MTRDEHRAKCIEAMIDDYIAEFRRIWPGSRPARTEAGRLMTAAFDSLHGVAFVNTIEATEEMVAAGMGVPHHENCCEVFAAMAARGNLTNPREGKP